MSISIFARLRDATGAQSASALPRADAEIPEKGGVGTLLQRPATVGEALDLYEADLKPRGGDAGNVARVRAHLPAGLREKAVALLTSRELRKWRDSLVKAPQRPATKAAG